MVDRYVRRARRGPARSRCAASSRPEGAATPSCVRVEALAGSLEPARSLERGLGPAAARRDDWAPDPRAPRVAGRARSARRPLATRTPAAAARPGRAASAGGQTGRGRRPRAGRRRASSTTAARGRSSLAGWLAATRGSRRARRRRRLAFLGATVAGSGSVGSTSAATSTPRSRCQTLTAVENCRAATGATSAPAAPCSSAAPARVDDLAVDAGVGQRADRPASGGAGRGAQQRRRGRSPCPTSAPQRAARGPTRSSCTTDGAGASITAVLVR